MTVLRARWIIALTLATILAGAAGSRAARAEPPAPAGAAGNRAWIFSRLAEGDALLRRGRPRAAARAFRDVFLQTQGTQWGPLAELGLAWSVATSGDAELGRALAADAHASAGSAAPATSVVLALLSARVGDYAEAATLLDQSAQRASDPAARAAIRLAQAYVAFWSGELERAAAMFDAVAAGDPDGSLVDDARYGAAWSRYRADGRVRALDDLAALVAAAPPGHVFRNVPQRLVELDARAILSASTRGHRRHPVQSPDAELARMLDGDGFSRARSALRLIELARSGRTTGLAASSPLGVPAAGADTTDSKLGLPAAASSASTAAAEREARRRSVERTALLGLLLVILVAAAWFLLRRAGRDAL